MTPLQILLASAGAVFYLALARRFLAACVRHRYAMNLKHYSEFVAETDSLTEGTIGALLWPLYMPIVLVAALMPTAEERKASRHERLRRIMGESTGGDVKDRRIAKLVADNRKMAGQLGMPTDEYDNE